MSDPFSMTDEERLCALGLSTARRRFSRCALALAVYTLVAYAAVLLITFLIPDSHLLSENIYFLYLMNVGPLYCIGLPILYLIVRKMKTAPPKSRPFSFKQFIILFLISRAFVTVGSYLSSILTAVISSLFGITLENDVDSLIGESPVLLIFLVVVILGPLVEEFIFRKLLIDRLRFYGDGIAIVFSSVLFGLAHGNFFQFIYSFLTGLILGYLYTRSGKYYLCFLLHALTNFIGGICVLPVSRAMAEIEPYLDALTASPTPQDLAALMGPLTVIGIWSSLSVTMTIAGTVLFFTMKSKIRLKKGTLWLEKKNYASVTLVQVGSILFLITSAFQFALSFL